MTGEKSILGKLLDREERISAQPGFLRPIDTKGLIKSLEIDSTALVNGQNDIPESNDTELDIKEKEIVQYLLGEYYWQADEFYSQLRAYSHRLTKYSIRSEFQRLKIQGKDTLAKLGAASIKAEADLGPKFELFRDRKQEYDDFRTKHQLARPARESSGMVFTIGLLVFLASIESVLNGFFFSKGADLGLLGGIGTAIGISLVNVTSAFLIGLGPARWIWHRSFVVKFIGLSLLIVFIFGTTGLQTFAAHFRDASVSAEGTVAFSEAIRSLIAHPYLLQDINSYYLVGLGLVFSLLSFLKGYFQDDPYPGYGAVWRRFTGARDNYCDEHDALFDKLEDNKDDCIEEINAGIVRLPKYPQTSLEIGVQRTAIVGKFKAYENALTEAVNELLGRYRERNKAHRTTPPPIYFSRKWKLSERVSESAESKALLIIVPEEKTDVDGPLTELNDLATSVLDKYSELFARYPHPTRLANG